MKKKLLAIIPARGGSKGIPGKNIKKLAGRPLISYSIEAALKSRGIDRVVVSTDDKEIAKISKKLGADVPYLRPKELAQDKTPIIPVLVHMINYLREKEGYFPYAVVLLQPTSPLRRVKHIEEAIKKFLGNPMDDSLVSVVRAPHNFQPVKLMKMSGGYLAPYLKGQGTKVFTRKNLPELYARNGPAILITKTKVITKDKSLYGKRIIPYQMSKIASFDIDDMEDWKIIESLIKTI